MQTLYLNNEKGWARIKHTTIRGDWAKMTLPQFILHRIIKVWLKCGFLMSLPGYLRSRAEGLHFKFSSNSPCGAGNCVGLQLLKDLQLCQVPKTSRLNSPYDVHFLPMGIKAFKSVHLAELVFHLCFFSVVSISVRPSVSTTEGQSSNVKASCCCYCCWCRCSERSGLKIMVTWKLGRSDKITYYTKLSGEGQAEAEHNVLHLPAAMLHPTLVAAKLPRVWQRSFDFSVACALFGISQLLSANLCANPRKDHQPHQQGLRQGFWAPWKHLTLGPITQADESSDPPCSSALGIFVGDSSSLLSHWNVWLRLSPSFTTNTTFI